MNYIIADTNIFYSDFYLESIEWKKLLLINNNEADYKVICLEFIFEEVVKKYSDSITKKLKLLSSMQNEKEFKMLKLGVTIETKEFYVSRYKESLKSILAVNGIDIIPYPQGENYLGLISKRYFESKKPFAVDKPSFPDSIIWYSIIDELKNIAKNESMHFITGNYKDFAVDKDNKEIFHDDLITELATVQSDRLYLYNDITSFLESQKEEFEKRAGERQEEERQEEERREEVRELLITGLQKNITTIEEIESLPGLELSEDDLQIFLEGQLSNYSLEGEYLYGWGDDVEVDESSIEIKDTKVEFANDYEGELIIELSTEANYSIVNLNPMYEEHGDAEFITEEGQVGVFEIRISVSLKLNDEVYSVKIEYDDEELVESYIEMNLSGLELL